MGLRRIVVAATVAMLHAPAWPEQAFITVASTTSTEQSGLFKHLLPVFEKKTGIQVRVVALGTGQALDMGKRGDADVVFVHDPEAERKFVDEGHGVAYRAVMHNDFVLIGPKADPARARGGDIASAFGKIFSSKSPFVSRSDRSGTHAAELRVWTMAGIDIAAHKGVWYRESGSGMGAALNTAVGMNAYVLTDRGTWLSFRNRGELGILVEGDPRLRNRYGVILVNPAKHPHVKRLPAQRFIDWLVSPEGRQAIADFRIGGEQLFFPSEE